MQSKFVSKGRMFWVTEVSSYRSSSINRIKPRYIEVSNKTRTSSNCRGYLLSKSERISKLFLAKRRIFRIAEVSSYRNPRVNTIEVFQRKEEYFELWRILLIEVQEGSRRGLIAIVRGIKQKGMHLRMQRHELGNEKLCSSSRELPRCLVRE